MTDPTPQLTVADLDGMSPEAIIAARDAGRCDVLLGRVPATPHNDDDTTEENNR